MPLKPTNYTEKLFETLKANPKFTFRVYLKRLIRNIKITLGGR